MIAMAPSAASRFQLDRDVYMQQCEEKLRCRSGAIVHRILSAAGKFSRRLPLCLPVLLVFSAMAASAQQAAPQGAPPPASTAVEPDRTVMYTHVGEVDLLSDLYLPKVSGLHPAVVLVHGGGWRSGDRHQLHRLAGDLASAGFVVMSIDYRLAPAVHYPTPVEDVTQAVLWLRNHAKELSVDPKRVSLVGSSAGAHLALMQELLPHPADAGVNRIVVMNGVLDLADEPGQEGMVTEFLGTSCKDDLLQCRAASPVTRAATASKPLPSVLLMHGTADVLVPYRQSEAMLAAWKAAGGIAELFTVPGAGHSLWGNKEVYPDLLRRMTAFLGG